VFIVLEEVFPKGGWLGGCFPNGSFPLNSIEIPPPSGGGGKIIDLREPYLENEDEELTILMAMELT
jgi:hypothetical protein